jgi:pimeloyl-ACP methyl ester carboxylesterase
VSGSTDPTATVVVTGGPVTAVDTEQILGQATVVRSAADLVRSARERCRDARESLRSAPWRWAVTVGGLGAGPQLSAHPVAAPGSTSARERDAALGAVDALDAALGELERLLDGVGVRMAKASGTYVRAEAEAWRVLGAVADVPLVGLEVALLAGQLAFLEGVLTGDGLPWGRLVTGGGPLHERAVASTGALLGLLDPDRGLLERPTVAHGASVLRLLSEGWRGLFLDRVHVERLGPEQSPGPELMPPPRTAQDLLRRIDTVYGTGEGNPVPHSAIALEKIVHDGGRATWVVTIPGTQLGPSSLGTAFSMTSNYDLMEGDELSGSTVGGRTADSTALVLAALEDAEVGADDEVVLVGHSQGGMVAASVAALTAGSAATAASSPSGTSARPGPPGPVPETGGPPRYRVTHVVTAGAPVGGMPLPPGVLGTHVENRQEGVSGLDGRGNPATTNQVTVSRDLDLLTGNETQGIPHGVGHHVDALTDAQGIGHPGLRSHLDALEASLDGKREEVAYYRGTLVLDPEAVADRMTPPGTLLPDPSDVLGLGRGGSGAATVVAPGPTEPSTEAR